MEVLEPFFSMTVEEADRRARFTIAHSFGTNSENTKHEITDWKKVWSLYFAGAVTERLWKPVRGTRRLDWQHEFSTLLGLHFEPTGKSLCFT